MMTKSEQIRDIADRLIYLGFLYAEAEKGDINDLEMDIDRLANQLLEVMK